MRHRLYVFPSLLLLISVMCSGAEPASTNGITRTEAMAVVTRAYREILHREPDPQGLEVHVKGLIADGHDEAWVRQVLSNSPEARQHARLRRERLRLFAAVTLVTCIVIFLVVYVVRRIKRRSIAAIILVNVVLTLAGLAIVIGLYEWHLRRIYAKYDFFQVGVENPDFRTGADYIPQSFKADPELGFVPVCGSNKYYSAFGTLKNKYTLAKPPNVTRLLFIGDSVTHRGELIRALKNLYGKDRFEYWNAGVEAYNTVQEVGFYRKYNRAIHPDHVILTMICNDMETTPLAFMDSGKLVLIAPSLPRCELNAWLFRHCYIYRRWVGQRVQRNSEQFHQRIREELITSLRSLNEELRGEGIKFTVLILPWLVPPDKCPKEPKDIQRDFVGIASNLNLRAFDLAVPIAAAAKDGSLRASDDTLHPNDKIAIYLAQWLKEKGIFDEQPGMTNATQVRSP
jgi:hypothetical protein